MNTNPLILTLTLDDQASAFFTAQREAHFPRERNFLKAHLTLFHQLPQQEEIITETLTELCGKQEKMQLHVVAPISIGNGVAYKIESKELQQLHGLLQQQWQPLLIAQDRQKLRPHITIQNKVKPALAKQLLEEIKETFVPFTVAGIGLQLWEYLGGPWAPFKAYDFQ